MPSVYKPIRLGKIWNISSFGAKHIELRFKMLSCNFIFRKFLAFDDSQIEIQPLMFSGLIAIKVPKIIILNTQENRWISNFQFLKFLMFLSCFYVSLCLSYNLLMLMLSFVNHVIIKYSFLGLLTTFLLNACIPRNMAGYSAAWTLHAILLYRSSERAKQSSVLLSSSRAKRLLEQKPKYIQHKYFGNSKFQISIFMVYYIICSQHCFLQSII